MLTDQILVACSLGLLQGVTYNEVDNGSTLLATRTVVRGFLAGQLGYFLSVPLPRNVLNGAGRNTVQLQGSGIVSSVSVTRGPYNVPLRGKSAF